MRRFRPSSRFLKLLLLGCLFVLQFLGAIALHLDTKVARALAGRWMGTFLSTQIRGRLDFGQIERLTTSSLWLTNVLLEDEQRRRVVSLGRVRVRAAPAAALFRWFTRHEPLTVMIESVQADGVRLALHVDPTTKQPSLLTALELVPRRGSTAAIPEIGPYRVFLPTIEAGEIRVESTLPSFATRSMLLRKVSGQLLLTDQGVAASLQRFSLDDSDVLSMPLHVFGALEFRSPRRIWGDFNLTLGQASCTGRIEYRKDVLALTVHPFRVTPAAGRQWSPRWSLQQPVEISLSANGPLDNLGVRLAMASDPLQIETVGTLQLGTSPKADLTITGHAIDLQTLTGSPVPSHLDAAARVALTVLDGQTRLQLDGVILPGQLLNFATPRIDLDATLDAEGLMLNGRSRDPKLPVRAAALFHNQVLEIDAQLDQVALEALHPNTWPLPISGLASARAKARWMGDRLSASLDVNLANAGLADLALGNARLAGSFEGPIGSPSDWSGELRLLADRLSFQGVTFDRVTSELKGSPRRAMLLLAADHAAGTSLRLSSVLSASQQPLLSQVKLDLSRGQQKLSFGARSLGWQNGELLVDALALDGSAGHARGSIGIADGRIFGELAGEALDLSVFAELLGVPAGSMSGTADLEVSLDTRAQPARGSARLALVSASVPKLGPVSGTIELQLLGNQVTGNAALGTDFADAIQGKMNLALGGSITRPSSYAEAVGAIDVQLDRIRVEELVRRLGWQMDTVRVSGVADAQVSLDRAAANQAPNLALGVRASALSLSTAAQQSTLRLENLDGIFALNVQGDTGSLHSSAMLSRNGQPKLELAATAQIPVATAWHDHASLLEDGWRQLPFDLGLHLHEQSLAELGEALGTTIGSGTAELQASIVGAFNSPHLVARLLGRDLLLASIANPLPFDADGLFEFDAGSRELRLAVSSGTKQQAWMNLNGQLTVHPCAEALTCVSDWDGRIEANLVALPLGAFPAISSWGINGVLRGLVTARRANGTTALDGLLPAANFTVSNHPLGQALFRASNDSGNLILGATFIDGGAQLDVEAHLPVDWRTLVPKQRTDGAIRIAASAVGYDAGIISPWTEAHLRDIEGELNFSVDASYQLGRNAAAAPSQEPQLAVNGTATLTHGKATLRDLGLTLSEISIAAQASSSKSRTTISVPTISANLGEMDKGFNGSLVAELSDRSLQRITGRIDRASDVPLISDSVTLATLTGAADFEVTPRDRGHLVAIVFDNLDVRLPRSSARKTRSLAENPDIVVLQPLGPSSYRSQVTATNPQYVLRLALGTKSKVTRSDFSLPIRGTPEVTLGARVRPQGNVELEPTGRLQLFGKSFAIDHGRVTLNPEQPSNPQIDVAATWRGPTHLVTVQIQGTVEAPRLRLSSDPPLPSEPQVMALLLGGSGGNDSAAGAGLGVGATLFNELLSDTALSRVEVRTSTNERHANYTAAVPLRDNLWFEATYHNSTNANLGNSMVQNGFSGTVDYRFRRNWSLRTEVGTLGAGADVLWQYRY